MKLINSIFTIILAGFAATSEAEWVPTRGRVMGESLGSACSNVTIDGYNAEVSQEIPCHNCGDKLAVTYQNTTVVLTASSIYVASEPVFMLISKPAYKVLVGSDSLNSVIMSWECLSPVE